MEFSSREWAALSELMDEAIDLTGPELERWLDRLPESCPVPKSVIRDLLSGGSGEGAGQCLGRLPDLFRNIKANDRAENPLFAGKIVAGYRLIRELGQGGMGAVWLGERTDGLVNRPVAIKVPHTGIYGRHFAERFRREREILASLTHPHIGRLYDAGISDEGTPFLALEYIEGTELIAYCDARQLNVRARLKLFLQALSAVHYANSRLVIHRDLKPSNILVGTDGQVKLLDFGVAKLMLDGDPGETDLTRIGGHALTPSYASPEQISAQPLSTASDVYSLGVILCELLTGERPYRKAGSRALLEQAILAGEIVRPSQALGDVEKARARRARVKELAATLRGDLDTITLKALNRQPDERYATADALAQDIERYLAGRPVLARPENVWYRARKFAWRNRFGVAAVFAVILALTVGLTAALWQARKAWEQAKTAEAVLEFMDGIFRANSSSQNDPIQARQTTAKELLDIGAARLDTMLNDVPAAKMRVLATLYDMYSDLDLWDKEVDLARQRVALARSMYGDTDPVVADFLLDLAADAENQDLISEQERAVREAGRILERQKDYASLRRARLESSLADYYLNVDFRQARAHSQSAVRLARGFPPSFNKLNILQGAAYFEVEAGAYRAAEEITNEALATANLVGPDANMALAWIHKHLAEAEDGADNFVTAEQNYTAARDLVRKYNGAQGVQIQLVAFAYADFLARSSRMRQALEIARQASEAALKLSRHGMTTSLLQSGTIMYASALIDYGRPEEGLEVLQEVTAAREHLPPALKLMDAQLDEVRSAGLIEVGRYEEAQKLLGQAAAIDGDLGRENTPSYSHNVVLRARVLNAIGRTDQALTAVAEYRLFAGQEGRANRGRLDELVTRSEICLAARDFNAARRLAAEARDLIATSPNRSYLAFWEARAALAEGRAALSTGKARDALPLLERAVSLRGELLDSSSPALGDAKIALGNCYFALHDWKRAGALVSLVKAIYGKHPALGDHYRKPLTDLERRLSGAVGRNP